MFSDRPWLLLEFIQHLHRINWIIAVTVTLILCLLGWYSYQSTQKPVTPTIIDLQTSSTGMATTRRRQTKDAQYTTRNANPSSRRSRNDLHSMLHPTHAKRSFDVFLVLDVEATCLPGTDFNWPNEIIEWPVCVMRWKDNTSTTLEISDEFRSFVRPIWRPQLSPFCTQLTGITQSQVDIAPSFPDMLASFRRFLVRNGLIEANTGRKLVRFCWCTDGPFDVRDFVVKQCFISQIPMPEWIAGNILDVRKIVKHWVDEQKKRGMTIPRYSSLNLSGQLQALALGPFKGRQHSGIDDTRNIARILAELARRGISLETNTVINPRRKWAWMGKSGEILYEHSI